MLFAVPLFLTFYKTLLLVCSHMYLLGFVASLTQTSVKYMQLHRADILNSFVLSLLTLGLVVRKMRRWHSQTLIFKTELILTKRIMLEIICMKMKCATKIHQNCSQDYMYSIIYCHCYENVL